MIALALCFELAHAQAPETPPMEPPYTDDTEFDPVLSEDPAASNDPIPVSPEPEIEMAPQKQSQAAPVTPVARPNKKGIQLLHHPDAKKGLIRIEQDGTYVYKVKMKKANETGTFRLGMMDPPKIIAADGIHDFSSMYGSEGLFTLMMEYEWQPFSKFGKLGLQLGVGFATAEGKGFFVNDPVSVPQESYTFFAVPMNIGLIYRFEYFDRQWVAPYVSGGGSYIGVAELRDDNKNSFTGTPAAYGAGGIMFNISALDRSLAFNLSNEYGVANLWLVGEYRYLQAFSEDLDFSGGVMSLGIGADF